MVSAAQKGFTLKDAVTGSMISISEEERQQVCAATKEAEQDPALFYMYMILMLGDMRNDLNAVLRCLCTNDMITIEEDDDAITRA